MKALLFLGNFPKIHLFWRRWASLNNLMELKMTTTTLISAPYPPILTYILKTVKTTSQKNPAFPSEIPLHTTQCEVHLSILISHDQQHINRGTALHGYGIWFAPWGWPSWKWLTLQSKITIELPSVDILIGSEYNLYIVCAITKMMFWNEKIFCWYARNTGTCWFNWQLKCKETLSD